MIESHPVVMGVGKECAEIKCACSDDILKKASPNTVC